MTFHNLTLVNCTQQAHTSPVWFVISLEQLDKRGRSIWKQCLNFLSKLLKTTALHTGK